MDTVVIGDSDSDDEPLIQKASIQKAKPSTNKGSKGPAKRPPRPQRRAKESSEDADSSSGSEVSSDEAPVAPKATKKKSAPTGKKPARKRNKARALYPPRAASGRMPPCRVRAALARHPASWQALMDEELLVAGAEENRGIASGMAGRRLRRLR